MKRKPSLLNDPFLDKEQLSFARQALRRASYKWKPRNEAIKNARISRGIYECALCKAHVPNKEKELDHVEPVIRTNGTTQTLGEFAARLYVYLEGWQVLCSSCHLAKSGQENSLRRSGRRGVRRKGVKAAA